MLADGKAPWPTGSGKMCQKVTEWEAGFLVGPIEMVENRFFWNF